MVSSNRVSFITLAILLVISFFSSLSGASPVRTSSNKFVAGKPLTQEEFNSPPRYSTPSEWSYVYQDNGDRLFQGDIVLPEWAETAEAYVGRNALINRERLWPNATIPYQISDVYDAEQRAVIASAMNEYHLKTCIRFVPHTDEEDYIQIQSISGCSSLIGQVEGGGPQPVSLDIDGCVRTDIVQHELMHAAGFHHEQSRYDRDDYVTIHWDNIQPNLTFNFVKISPERIEFLGTLYNYSSIMHYDAYAFAIDPTKPTITANDGSPLRGYVFAESDLLKVNRQYNCNSFLTETCWDDDARFCPDLAANGTCTTIPQEMIIRCKKSCNFCDQPDCYDVAAECHTWAVEGRCQSDPDFMKEQGCKRSCLTCLP